MWVRPSDRAFKVDPRFSDKKSGFRNGNAIVTSFGSERDTSRFSDKKFGFNGNTTKLELISV